MEGLLWKWTNYWSGWQPRWFILDKGILSYYNSQDEVGQGCKGSIKMSVCDVHVDHGDPCRLELVIAREQHFYLKAANEKERQQWLVALGSCKATLQAISEPNQRLLLSGVKQKRSELRIYCDLLMQQVHAIKEANSSTPIDTVKIDQCSQLLSETCDTFINTLEDCMKIVDKPSKSRHSSAREVTKPSSPVNPGMKHLHSPTHERHPPRSILRNSGRSTSQSSTDTDLESPSVNAKPAVAAAPANDPAYVHSRVGKHKNGELITQSVPERAEVPAGDAVVNSTSPANQKPGSPASTGSSNHAVARSVPANFFNTMGTSFVSMVDGLADGVNTKDFTASAAELAKLFDKLSSSAFSPIKNDLLGNVKKIEQKWTTDPKSLCTLQKLVTYEIDHGQHLDPNSATQALLWLTRGLLFVSNIVLEYPARDSLYEAVTIAYEKTLKPFHNFVVRGVVSIGLRAMPYKSGFIACLAADPNIDPTDEYFISTLYVDGNQFQSAVCTVCQPIIDFYKQRNMIVIQES